jgi:Txe/YoeB family toxin of Txe-Axe toxin-antitoxin module
VRRVNSLIKDIQRDGDAAIGKPELLRGELSGFA